MIFLPTFAKLPSIIYIIYAYLSFCANSYFIGRDLAALLGDGFLRDFPFIEHEDGSLAQPVTRDVEDLLLNMTWKTFMCITGAKVSY